MALDITIPCYDEMDLMTVDELKEWKAKIAPYYANRFEMSLKDSMQARKYIFFEMMLQNIEEGADKWNRIDHNRLTVLVDTL